MTFVSTEREAWETECESLGKSKEPFRVRPIVHNDHKRFCDRFCRTYGYLWFMGKDKCTAIFIPSSEW